MIFERLTDTTAAVSDPLRDFSPSRRMFLRAGVAAGGGLLLSLSLPFANGDAQVIDGDDFAPNAFIRIERNGRIVLIMPYVEMGQGTYTSIPMLIAEELEVDLKQVELEHAPPDPKLYGNPIFGGIQSTGGLDLCSRLVAAASRSRSDCANHARVGGRQTLECRSHVLPRAKR
jgi:isoquinoline 1-oxidoreductase beta subunit